MQGEPFFLTDNLLQTHRFCIYYPATSARAAKEVLGVILYIHPFAEEMNKSRQMAALQARAFSKAGFAVLQIDLSGCGDSAGNFEDATWSAWINDIVDGYRWMERKLEDEFQNILHVPLWLWGLRAGCLLASEVASHLNRNCHFLFWQPSISGEKEFTQLMRLKRVSNMLNGVGSASKKEFDTHGTAVEVLGYTLSRELIQGLTQARLGAPENAEQIQGLVWIELTPNEQEELAPESFKTLELWKSSGISTVSHLLRGPSFWCSNEIECSTALIAQTTKAVSSFSVPNLEPEYR